MFQPRIVLLLLLAATAARADYTAYVDPNTVVVTNFAGWGTSLCWWANVVGGYSNRNDYANLAFSQLQLNIVRYNIGGGENPGLTNTITNYRAIMQGFEPANGVWNWNADANQRWMLQAALARGANLVDAFANSPPWWMTVSSSVTGAVGGTNNLQVGYEGAFTAYLSTVVSNLTVLDGVHFDFVTPMNEPSDAWAYNNGKQEGCHMSHDQQARVVGDLRAALNTNKLSAGIDAPEDYSEQNSVDDLTAYPATNLATVALITTHTYSANNPAGLRNLAASEHKPLWVSEYGDGDATGLTMARRIHDDIAVMWARAWVYWQVVDNAGGWGFLYNPLTTNSNGGFTTNYTINEKFYVLGQFSEFIRPGCQIVSVGDTNSLAAYNPSNSTLVIVTVNTSTNSFHVTYDLSAFGQLPSQVSVHRTSSSENIAALAPLPVNNQQFISPILPQSVTTHVLTNVVPAPRSSGPEAWYPFEGDAEDASGNGNNGVIVGHVTFVPGKVGAQAAQFDGVSSYVQIPRSISNDFTVACWINTTATGGGSQWWAGKGLVDGEVAGSTNDFGMCLVDNEAAFGVGDPDTTITSTNTINDGQWHHVAATRDSVSGQMQLFVDGVLQSSTIGPTDTRNAPPALRIGSIQAGYSGGFLAGAIDDVRLFGRILSAAEIGQLMTTVPAVTAWGDNTWGQTSVPNSTSNAIAVAAGAWHSLALRTDGTVVAWGADSNGQCDVPPTLTNVLAIAAGGYHSLAIKADGTVAAWGANDSGQTSVPSGLAGVIAIAAGTWHSLALCSDGTVVAWGDDSLGQTEVPPGLSNVVAIAAGGSHNLALQPNGTLSAWGDNNDAYGNFAGESVVPSALTNATAIAAGEYHSLATQPGGTVVAWGDNSAGQCSVPPGLSNIVALSGGGAHSLGLIANGTVASWGLDTSGQCSLARSSSEAVALSAGEDHSVVLLVGSQPVPRLFWPTWRPGAFSVVMQTLNRTNYALDFKSNLAGGSWTPLETNAGNGALLMLTDPTAPVSERFYRARLSR